MKDYVGWRNVLGVLLIATGVWLGGGLYSLAEITKEYARDEILIRYKSGTSSPEIRKSSSFDSCRSHSKIFD